MEPRNSIDHAKKDIEEDIDQRGFIRFVCISDTHALHENLSLPKGDVLFHCGIVLLFDEFNLIIFRRLYYCWFPFRSNEI